MTDHDEGLIAAKRELRGAMRSMRRSLPDRPERSARIVEHLMSIDAVRTARRVLAYDAIVGEVDTAELIRWCRSNGLDVAMPEDDVAADWPDVIIVPGTAFTTDGRRIGQGGGWYDRFLPGRRDDAVTIGIGFAPQLVDDLPTEPHDVVLDIVVTDEAIHPA